MSAEPTITVELYGIPRQRAGCTELKFNATTVGQMLDQLEAACPGLRGTLRVGQNMSPHYLLSINGERFVSALTEPLTNGTQVILLSADAGG